MQIELLTIIIGRVHHSTDNQIETSNFKLNKLATMRIESVWAVA